MIGRTWVGVAWILAGAAILLDGCSGNCDPDLPPPVRECTDPVVVVVTGDTLPVFSWTPDCTLGRLLVESGPNEEYWATEACARNIYRSPIVYGVHPPGADEPQVANPLSRGITYTVSVYRWPTANPDSCDTGFRLIGSAQFTP